MGVGSVAEVERKYALRRIKAGDYLLIGNDDVTLWRISKYVDGPSTGLEDWPRDREVWGLRKWETPIVLGEKTGIEVENWDRWEFWEGPFDRRQEAIDAACRPPRKPAPKKPVSDVPIGRLLAERLALPDTNDKEADDGR
jgi:hypothetical protein